MAIVISYLADPNALTNQLTLTNYEVLLSLGADDTEGPVMLFQVLQIRKHLYIYICVYVYMYIYT